MLRDCKEEALSSPLFLSLLSVAIKENMLLKQKIWAKTNTKIPKVKEY